MYSVELLSSLDSVGIYWCVVKAFAKQPPINISNRGYEEIGLKLSQGKDSRRSISTG
jgi:hypothetical protein